MIERSDRQGDNSLHEGVVPTRWWRLGRVFLVGLLVVFLLWSLITKQLPNYLAMHAPEAALVLDPGHPVALVTLADRLLNGVNNADNSDAAESMNSDTPSPLGHWAVQASSALSAEEAVPKPSTSNADRARIKTLAEKALLRDPLNHRALRILGQLADAEGDRPSARQLMQAAAQRSLRATYAVYWLMFDSFNRHDYAGSVDYADLLLRKRPQLYNVTYPLLAQIAESQDKSGHKALTSALAADPVWRSAFLRHVPEYVHDARTPFSLLRALKDSSSPPDNAEINAYLDFLISKRIYEFAYYVWLQALPSESFSTMGFLVNGSFEQDPSGAPFDWSISGGAGVTIDIAQRFDADGEHALYLEFGPGRTRFKGVSQLVMLSPGRYRLSGRLQGEVSGKRGLRWQISCLPKKEVVGETPMFLGSTPQWSNFAAEFEIPADGCRMQQLRLIHASRSSSEELVSGSIWYDAIELSRLAAEARN